MESLRVNYSIKGASARVSVFRTSGSFSLQGGSLYSSKTRSLSLVQDSAKFLNPTNYINARFLPLKSFVRNQSLGDSVQSPTSEIYRSLISMLLAWFVSFASSRYSFYVFQNFNYAHVCPYVQRFSSLPHIGFISHPSKRWTLMDVDLRLLLGQKTATQSTCFYQLITFTCTRRDTFSSTKKFSANFSIDLHLSNFINNKFWL